MWVAIEDHLGAFGGHGRPFGVRWIGIWGNVVALDAHWVVRGSHLGSIWWPDSGWLLTSICIQLHVRYLKSGIISKGRFQSVFHLLPAREHLVQMPFVDSVQDPATWILDPGAWILGPGSGILDTGPWIPCPGSWVLDPRGGGRREFSARLGLARLGSENGLWLGSARLGSPRLGAGSARLARSRLARVWALGLGVRTV